MKNLLLILSLIMPIQAYSGDSDIEKILKGTAALLLLNELYKESHTHIPPMTSRYGIYYEPVDGPIARTHCPVKEHIFVYNRYGNRKEYIVRDCRR